MISCYHFGGLFVSEMNERFGAATKQKSLRGVLDDKVVVDAFDFIYITYEDSSDGELSRVKTKPIGDDPNTKYITSNTG